MAELTLVYSQLEDVSKYARKVSGDCDDYKVELGKKLTNQWVSVPKSPLSTGNSRIQSAGYYVKQKSKRLEEKRKAYKSFADDVDDLVEVAKAADKAVAKSVNGSREAFLKEHTNLKGDGWSAFFANLVVNVPVIGWIAEKISDGMEGLKNLVTNIRYWYEVCGGKKLIDNVLAIATIVLEVIGLVVAVIAIFAASGVWGIIAAVAGVIAAVIGVVNSIVNLYYQNKANKEDDPAWANYYGGTDKASDALRKTTFKDDRWNKWSGGIANGLDITETLCNLINIAEGIGNLYKRSGIKKLFSSEGKFDFKKFKNTIFTKEGWSNIGKSLKHSWKGMVFGDSGGVEGWKKRWKRAFTSQNTDSAERVKKILTVIKGDFSKITNGVKMTDSILDTISNGFKFDSVYKPTKYIYSSSGNKGAVEKGFETVDLTREIFS